MKKMSVPSDLSVIFPCFLDLAAEFSSEMPRFLPDFHQTVPLFPRAEQKFPAGVDSV
jgi:hypothetical protein